MRDCGSRVRALQEPVRRRGGARVLEDAIERSLPDDALDATDEDVRALVDVRAFVARRRGAIALDTEDWSAGETFLERARALLSRPTASPAARRVPLLQTNNALGVLWCNRGDPERALPSSTPPATRTTPGPGPPRGGDRDTETLFFLAQAYARLGREDDSASACATCLRRQVERAGGAPAPDPTEWAQNAAQLSGFYVSRAAWSTARHCVAAAERVFRDAHPTWAPKHGPHATPADERAAANAPDPDPDSADVGANAQLAWGKLHLRRLTTARDLAVTARGGVETEAAAAARASATNGDDARLLVSFPSLGLDDGGARAASREARAVGLASEGPSEGWIPRDVVGARKVFNEAAPRYRAALSRYTLDGFVTEHCDALMDVSALLKSLAFFERGDRRRHNSLHRRRVERLEPAASSINPSGSRERTRRCGSRLARHIARCSSSRWRRVDPRFALGARQRGVASLSAVHRRVRSDARARRRGARVPHRAVRSRENGVEDCGCRVGGGRADGGAS